MSRQESGSLASQLNNTCKAKIRVSKVHSGNNEYNQTVGHGVCRADDDGELGWAKV